MLALLGEWEVRTRGAVRAATLGTKLVQLTLPGVADVYQGTEVPAPTLVDPDNRRPVDAAALAARLARLDEGAGPRGLADEKVLAFLDGATPKKVIVVPGRLVNLVV